MSTNPNRRPYPPEFRRDAVALYRRSGHSLKDVAEDLGVSLESLRHPNKQLDVDEGRAERLVGAERDELARLRRENRTLREEREVLRKAAAFFATESERR